MVGDGFDFSAAEAAAALAGEGATDGLAGDAADGAADDTPVVLAGNGAIEGGTDSVEAGEAERATEGTGNDVAEGSV